MTLDGDGLSVQDLLAALESLGADPPTLKVSVSIGYDSGVPVVTLPGRTASAIVETVLARARARRDERRSTAPTEVPTCGMRRHAYGPEVCLLPSDHDGPCP